MTSKLLQYIRDGVKTVEFFDYNDKLLKIRPLTTSEIDDSKMKGYKYLNPKLAGLIVKMNLGLIKPDQKIDVDNDAMYINIDKFTRELDYHIVYHSMKDFMPDDFTIKDVRKMQFVHDIAKKVLSITSKDTNTVIEFITTADGQELAQIIYKYNISLVSKITDLTPLQYEFLKWSHPEAPKKVANNWDELGKVLPELGRLLDGRRD